MTAQDHVAALQGAVLHQQRRLDALALRLVCFKAGAGARTVRVGLQLAQLGHKADGVEQVVDALAGGGAGLHERRVAAHVVGQDIQAVELLLRLLEIGVG